MRSKLGSELAMGETVTLNQTSRQPSRQPNIQLISEQKTILNDLNKALTDTAIRQVQSISRNVFLCVCLEHSV